MAFLNDASSTGVHQLKPKIDADGKIWLMAYAAAGATRKTKISIQLHQYGWQAKAIADTAATQLLQYIAFPKATYSSGQYGWFQIGGPCSDAVVTTTTGTVGYGIKLTTDTVITTGATAKNGSDCCFGAFMTAKATSTTHDIMLFPERIDGAD